MGSSLPKHGARIRTKTQSKKKKKTKGRLQVSTKKYRTKIYMMHEQIKCHDACPSAVQISSN